MPTSRPGFVYDGTQWVQIGSQPVAATVKIQSTQPTSPQTGDAWLDNTVVLAPILKVYNGSSWIALGSSSDSCDEFFLMGS
jgi:hypothetical protein